MALRGVRVGLGLAVATVVVVFAATASAAAVLCPPGSVAHNATTCVACTDGFASSDNTCVACAPGYSYSNAACTLTCSPLTPANYFSSDTFGTGISSGTVLVTALFLLTGAVSVLLVVFAYVDTARHPQTALKPSFAVANYMTDTLMAVAPMDTVLCVGTRLLLQCCDVCDLSSVQVVVFYSALSLTILCVGYLLHIIFTAVIGTAASSAAHTSYLSLARTTSNLAFTIVVLALNMALLYTATEVTYDRAMNTVNALLVVLSITFLIGLGGSVLHVGQK